MINKLGLERNKFYDLDYINKPTSKKSSHLSPKQNDNNLQYSKDNLSQICDKNIQSKFTRVKSKNKNKNKNSSFSSYQYIIQKASKFVNNNINKTNKLKNEIELIHRISPLKKENKNIIFSTPIYPDNNPINRNEKRVKIRNLSMDENRNTIDNSKRIKEIRIKSSKKFSQECSSVNKNNNVDAENKMLKIHKLNSLENMHQNSLRNSMKIETPKLGVYLKKRLKIFKSVSVDKKLNDTIKSIEIDFSPKISGNSYTDVKNQYSFKITKIIKIQRFFRKYANIRHKMRILKGALLLKKNIFKNLDNSMKKIFLLKELNKKNKKKYFVKKEQYEMLKILKRKNIFQMIDLKKYIVGILNKNKIELF